MDGHGHSGGRWRREEMSPQREAMPAGRSGSGWPSSGQRSAGSGSSFRGGWLVYAAWFFILPWLFPFCEAGYKFLQIGPFALM